MKYKFNYVIILISLIFSSYTSFEQNNILPGASLKPYGRYLFDAQQNLEL